MFGRSPREILAEDITDFLGELSVLLETDISLAEALALTRQSQEKPAMSALIDAVANEARQGHGLAAGLAAHPRYFQPFLVEALRQAEAGNRLPAALAEIARYCEASGLAEIDLAGRMKAALAYPAVLLLIVVFIVGFMAVYVVPVFGEMFREFGANLPAPTVFVLGIADGFVAYWYIPVALVVLLFAYFWRDKKNQGAASRLDYLKAWLALHSPGLGKIYHYLEIIRSLRAWDFMLAQNASVEQALEASALAVHTPIYADALRRMRGQIAAGTPLAEVLQQQRLLPKKAGHALLIAERGGHSRRLLAKLADTYTQKAKAYFKQSSRFFTLVLIIAVWLIIGFIVIAMYLPIFQIGQVL